MRKIRLLIIIEQYTKDDALQKEKKERKKRKKKEKNKKQTKQKTRRGRGGREQSDLCTLYERTVFSYDTIGKAFFTVEMLDNFMLE